MKSVPALIISAILLGCQSSKKDYFAVGWKVWGECKELCGGADQLWSVSEVQCECMDRTKHKHSRSPVEISDESSKSLFDGLLAK